MSWAERFEDGGPADDPHGSSQVAVDLHGSIANEPALLAPWAALAALEEPCPGHPSLLLVRRARPHWQNSRLAFSPEQRATTAAQRRELLRRDGYRCSTPGCPNHLWLAVHHVVFYCEGGVTVPANLVVCCSNCHRNIHRGLLRVTGRAPDQLHWTDRHGNDLGRYLGSLLLSGRQSFRLEGGP